MNTLKTIQINDSAGLQGHYRFHVYKAGTQELKRTTDWVKNKILFSTDRGAHLILQALIGNSPLNMLNLNYAAIGTGTAQPTEADTGLASPVLLNIQRSNQEIQGKTIVLRYFMADDELVSQEYREFALYAGSQIFTRSLITPTFNKTTNEDVIVEYIITVIN